MQFYSTKRAFRAVSNFAHYFTENKHFDKCNFAITYLKLLIFLEYSPITSIHHHYSRNHNDSLTFPSQANLINLR